MEILVIDGQGGRIGQQLIKAILARYPQVEVTAIGTNSLATSAMLKGGASQGATGENALLEHRQYTKPADWRGIKVPDVLLSGDHAKVDRFRRDEALAKTNELRPDLIEALACSKLDKADRKTLMALGWEVSGAHPRQR